MLRTETLGADHQVANTSFECLPVVDGVEELVHKLLHLHEIQVCKHDKDGFAEESNDEVFVVAKLMRLTVGVDGCSNLLLVNQLDEFLEDGHVQLEACEMAAVSHHCEQLSHDEHVEARVELGADHSLTAHLLHEVLETEQ